MPRIEVCIASNPQVTIDSADTRGAPFPRLLRGQTYQFQIALNINDPLFTDSRFPFSIAVSNSRFQGVCSGDVYYGKRYDVAPFFAYDFTPPSTIVPVTSPVFPYLVPALGGLIDDLNWVAVVIQLTVTIPASVPAGSYQLAYADAGLPTNYPVPVSLEVTSEATGSPIAINPLYVAGALAIIGSAIFIYWYWNKHGRR